ncbi:Dehydrosqualene desaturase [Bacillus sp. THAF10]|uniref:phytoene desaturase family protein n=1 Tax=Bacillus sp. THAF10 TaxID=2587848 RepID=UPI001268757F|nr:phytoene desaturase family protein [Bacillus sp. THAF10]QFT88325.1 Dehydrosqualene desaturase [Bacillus sp. THAF10]
MTKKKIAIAGAGIGGMVTALLLQKQGFDVSIFEKEKKAGGRLSFIERDGYRIDEGPTIVLLPHLLKEVMEEAGVDERAWSLKALETLYSITFKDGKTYTKFKDKDEQLRELSRQFPGEEASFERYMKEMHERFEIGNAAFLQKSFVRGKDFWTFQNMKSLMKLKAYQSTKKLTSTFFKNKQLQEAYSLQTLYIGGNPHTAPAMYSLIPFSEHEHGIYYVEGGYASLVSVLEEELAKRDIPIYLSARVEKVAEENGKVVSIKVNGENIQVDALVWNGDYPQAANMLGDKKRYKPSSGCLLFYFGIDGIYENKNVHQFFMGENFEKHMREIFEEKKVPTDPSFYTFNPSGMDSTLAPNGKSVLYTLVPVPSGDHINWQEETAFINKMVDEIESRAFPELKKRMEWLEVKTPNDAGEKGLFMGGSFGLAPELLQSGVFRPQVKPTKLANLYATGASIHPGGGIPIVLQSARHAAHQIVKDFAHHSFTKDVNQNERLKESISSL